MPRLAHALACIPLLVPIAFRAALAASTQGEPEPAPPAVEEDAPAPAEPAALERLLAAFERALADGDARAAAAGLRAMHPHSNPELFEAAEAGASYRLSKADEEAVAAQAEELGMGGRDELAALRSARRAEVRGAAARLAGNFPGRAAERLLLRLFKEKDLARNEPAALAGAIDGLGRIGCDRVEKDVVGLMARFLDERVSRASVRYLGQLPTRDKRNALRLCDMLSAPQPANVDDPTNPPAGFWEVQWKAWQVLRRDVSWSLQRITGQLFEAEDGGHPGDAKKARDFIEANAHELGLR